MLVGRLEMGDQPLAVPVVQRKARRIGDDHRPAVGHARVDRRERQRHLRRGRRAHRQRPPLPAGDDRRGGYGRRSCRRPDRARAAPRRAASPTARRARSSSRRCRSRSADGAARPPSAGRARRPASSRSQPARASQKPPPWRPSSSVSITTKRSGPRSNAYCTKPPSITGTSGNTAREVGAHDRDCRAP